MCLTWLQSRFKSPWLSHTRCREVVSPCGFNLHFPNDSDVEHLFYVVISYLFIFFGEMFVKTSVQIFKLACLSYYYQ